MGLMALAGCRLEREEGQENHSTTKQAGRARPAPHRSLLSSEGNRRPGARRAEHRYPGWPHPTAREAPPASPGEPGTEKPEAAEEAATAPAARARPAAGQRRPQPPVRGGGGGRGARTRVGSHPPPRAGPRSSPPRGRRSPGRSRRHRNPAGRAALSSGSPFPQAPPPLGHWLPEKRACQS